MSKEEILAELAKWLDPVARFDAKVSATLGCEAGAPDAYLKHVPRVECADGFNMSVQASSLHYCSPRDSAGPWDKVEVGFPTAKVDAFMPYIDGGPDDDPLATVYGYVPLELVADAIIAHGGFAKPVVA